MVASIITHTICSCNSVLNEQLYFKIKHNIQPKITKNSVVLETSHPVYYMYSYTEGYKYRLKRIENQNTITTMYNPNIWNVGDTILLRFTQPE